MEIILREDVQHLGAAGDVVKVKDGYARNYLLPKGLAYPATEANKKKIAYEAERIARQRAAEKGAAETEAAKLVGVHLTFAVKVGEEDKLYGSVTAGDSATSKSGSRTTPTSGPRYGGAGRRRNDIEDGTNGCARRYE
ncbi:MAG: 50S ribosomal protein L9 [Gemmatimonadetes bacterium 13_1_40CM_70_12]|nr:MAG: 50S ribosomal protein L9 [Gemmatimonadetes bacterium 13_1_40CM_70_12]